MGVAAADVAAAAAVGGAWRGEGQDSKVKGHYQILLYDKKTH